MPYTRKAFQRRYHVRWSDRWNTAHARAQAKARSDRELTNGQGKLCAALGIDKR